MLNIYSFSLYQLTTVCMCECVRVTRGRAQGSEVLQQPHGCQLRTHAGQKERPFPHSALPEAGLRCKKKTGRARGPLEQCQHLAAARGHARQSGHLGSGLSYIHDHHEEFLGKTRPLAHLDSNILNHKNDIRPNVSWCHGPWPHGAPFVTGHSW